MLSPYLRIRPQWLAQMRLRGRTRHSLQVPGVQKSLLHNW